MTEESPILKKLKTEYAEAKLARSTWNDHWQQLKRFIRPNSPDFYSTIGNTIRGNRRHDEIYDSTAPWSLDQFASGLSSVLTDMSSRWFGLGVVGRPSSSLSRDESLYLEFISDRIYHEFATPDTMTYQTLHENYIDIGCFGTTVQYQYWSEKEGIMKFRACPLADCFLIENEIGAIDKIFYRRVYSTRQLILEFPDLLKLEGAEMRFKANRDWEVVQAVFPRKERNLASLFSQNKPYASFYFCPDLPVVLEETGYDYFPYNTARWTKIAGETYGRSPGMPVLADIRSVNQMQKELLVSAQLANYPPLIAEDESILLQLAGDNGNQLTLTPKSVLWIEQGSQPPVPLNSGMQPQLTLEMLDGLRESIQRAFFVNHLIRAKKKERQTTTEILDDRGEMMRQLQPNFGRINAELLDNMIKTAYYLLDKKDQFPDPPGSLSGKKLEIIYFSPASKAQLGTKAQNISGFLQDITPIIGVAPQISERIDWTEMLDEYARARDIPTKVIKSPEQIAEAEQRNAQQAEQQQKLDAAPGMAKAAKDIAEAKQIDPALLQEFNV